MSGKTISKEFIPVPGGLKYEEIRVYDLARYAQRRKVTIKSDFYLTQCSVYVSIWTEHGWKVLYEKAASNTFLADKSNTGTDPDEETRHRFFAEADLLFAKASKIIQ